ncbi:MAG: putative AAA+ superfamily ATPase [Planctomycetota bacterium]|jgi:predicted AAA+ superfamily ATPase
MLIVKSLERPKDLDDAVARETDRIIREEITPAAEAGKAAMVAALLANWHAEAITARYGAQLLRVLRVREATLAPMNSKRRVRERQLADCYAELTGSGKVLLGGEEIALTKTHSLMNSESTELRHEAWSANFDWYRDERDELAANLDEFVQVRDLMRHARSQLL